MEGRLPDFMIIGAMKSGTTSLHAYLGKHPDIFMSKTKEIHYFADEKYLNYDLQWYKNHFVSNKKLVGTSPQNYTKRHHEFYKNIPERISKDIPKVKLIYILRDPIERYKSHILENYFGESKNIILNNINTKHFEKTGLYYYQLQEYLKYFDLSQIHILTMENLKNNRLQTLNNIFQFLGVEEVHDESQFDFISNTHEEKALPARFISALPFRLLNRLSPSLTSKIAKNEFLKNYLYKGGKEEYLSEQEIQRLKDIYINDVKKLESLTGISFNDWNL